MLSDKTSPARMAQCCGGCPPWLLPVLLCFSARANLRKLLALRVGDDALAPVHGLRVISLLWVILAHVSLIIFHLAGERLYPTRQRLLIC